MSRVEEIEAAIRELPPDEFRRISKCVHEIEQAQWDQQMDLDSAAGKLDFLFEEAEAEFNGGLRRNWPAGQ